MNYTDEESRLIFHKSKNSLLQMVCQNFESACFLYYKIPEFIDLLDKNTALLGIPGIEIEQAEALVSEINKQFPRKDEFLTCKIMDGELSLFSIFVTGSDDFKNVN